MSGLGHEAFLDEKYNRLKKAYDKYSDKKKKKLNMEWIKKTDEYNNTADQIKNERKKVSQNELNKLLLEMSNHIDEGYVYWTGFDGRMDLLKLNMYRLAQIYMKRGGDGKMKKYADKYRLTDNAKRYPKGGRKYVDHPVYGRLRY